MKTLLFAVPALLVGAGVVGYSAYSQPVAQPIQLINTPVEVQPVVETVAEPVVAPQKEEPIQVAEPAPAPTPDPYCAKYASKYSQAEYNKQQTKPDKIEEDCEDDNEDRDYKMNCKNLRKKHDQAFSDWVEQYDSYHARCSSN